MSVDIEKVKQNNNELKEIINNSWNGIGIIDKNSKLIYINNAFSPILGYPKEEITEKNFVDFIDTPENKNAFLELIAKNIDNKYISDIQVICLRKDGAKVYLELTLSLMLNKKFFVININDITKQISDSEILDSYVISSHTDVAGTITKVSDAFCKVSGYTQNELVGKAHSIIKHPDSKSELFKNLWETIKSGKEWNGKIKNKKKDGGIFWVNATIKPIYNKYGDITGYTSLMFDITNELSLIDQKENLETKVDEANIELKQKDEILLQQSKLAIMGETLQLVSHEWRQPLNVISIQAQKLEIEYAMSDTIDPKNVIETVHGIKEKATELSQTIEDFQSFVSLRSEKKESNPQQIIQKAVEIFKNSTDSHKLDFLKDTMETPDFKTYSNELTNVLVNILINAKEAILRKNSKTGVIKLKEYYIDNTVFFEVSDNGGGIDESIIDKIFDPYFSTKEERHGVGLGLYMCKIIVEMHLGGKIEVRNHNTGATFKITLPMN